LQSAIKKQKTMLDKQILKDQPGTPYSDIETFDIELPQWGKDFIDKRLDMAQRFSGRLKPVEMLF
jgi:hypothetical protein